MTIHFRPPASRPCFPQQFPDSRLNAPLRAEQLVRHVRETGALIGQLPKSKGGRGKTAATDARSFHADAGISASTHRAMHLAACHRFLQFRRDRANPAKPSPKPPPLWG